MLLIDSSISFLVPFKDLSEVNFYRNAKEIAKYWKKVIATSN